MTPQLTIQHGTLQGTENSETGIRAFKGIPFAAPPVGALRWQPPQAVVPWQGTHDATHFGPRAMQLPVFGDMSFRSNGMSEDCLYLNVWTPAHSEGEHLPVLLYFYGGGHIAGDGSEPRYDGESLAQRGIIVVTANYRLNIFGFLAHPDLSANLPHQSSGNYGLLDQAAALEWVHTHIAAFGGDPTRITIAGESAGSMSVSGLMVSPLSKHLMAGAIGSSGALLGRFAPVPLDQAEAIGAQFAHDIGAETLADLYALPAEALLNATTSLGIRHFPPVIDGYFLPRTVAELYQAGEQAKVPLLVGWNSEEMNAQALLGKLAPTPDHFADQLRTHFGETITTTLLQLYPAVTEAEVLQAATDLAGDQFMGYSTWKWGALHHQAGNPVYRYLYTHPRPPMTPEMGNAIAGLAGGIIQDESATLERPPIPQGAVHSADIEYFMGNLATNPVYAWTADDYQASDIMQGYYANFVKHGNPTPNESPQWLPLGAEAGVPVMQIVPQPYLQMAQHEARYEFWAQMDS